MLSHPPPHPHHRRFYILVTTVVLGAILILMLMNDNGNLGLTGSTIGVLNEDGDKLSEAEEEAMLEELGGNGAIAFNLNFDNVPEVAEEEARVGLLKVTFDDLNSKIKINNEELELKGLEDVSLQIEGFNGEIEFDEVSLSMSGEGEKLIVNGIEITTKGLMELSFRNLVYDTLEVIGVEVNSFETAEGRGELRIGEKMNYDLDFESLKVQGFSGDLSVGLNNDSLLVMNGDVSGVAVDGEFDLTLG